MLYKTICSFQSGCEEVQRSHKLQRADLQHFHTMWELPLLWQRGRDGVRLEHIHRCEA